jgi:hypothetical protein
MKKKNPMTTKTLTRTKKNRNSAFLEHIGILIDKLLAQAPFAPF